jgi:hypothetical protein
MSSKLFSTLCQLFAISWLHITVSQQILARSQLSLMYPSYDAHAKLSVVHSIMMGKFTEWQWPISGVHSIMMEISALAFEGGGAR